MKRSLEKDVGRRVQIPAFEQLETRDYLDTVPIGSITGPQEVVPGQNYIYSFHLNDTGAESGENVRAVDWRVYSEAGKASLVEARFPVTDFFDGYTMESPEGGTFNHVEGLDALSTRMTDINDPVLFGLGDIADYEFNITGNEGETWQLVVHSVTIGDDQGVNRTFNPNNVVRDIDIVPENATAALLAAGGVLAFARRRRNPRPGRKEKEEIIRWVEKLDQEMLDF